MLLERGHLLRERVVFLRELLSGLEIVFGPLPGRVRGEDLRQFRVATVDLARARRVGVHSGVGKLVLQILVLFDQCRDRLKHFLFRLVLRGG